MHSFLEIRPEMAVGAHHDIGADARLSRDVASGVGDDHVAGIVAHGLPGLRSGRVGQCVKKILRRDGFCLGG
ncbi:MAG: hypothetical protein R3F31_12315 [Verrucomicrobiales bacterium]